MAEAVGVGSSSRVVGPALVDFSLLVANVYSSHGAALFIDNLYSWRLTLVKFASFEYTQLVSSSESKWHMAKERSPGITVNVLLALGSIISGLGAPSTQIRIGSQPEFVIERVVLNESSGGDAQNRPSASKAVLPTIQMAALVLRDKFVNLDLLEIGVACSGTLTVILVGVLAACGIAALSVSISLVVLG